MLQFRAMQRLAIHPDNPQARHIKRAVEGLRAGNLLVYPTDTTYGLGCDIYAKRSIDRIYQLKGLDAKHPLSFLCADLSGNTDKVVSPRGGEFFRQHNTEFQKEGPVSFVNIRVMGKFARDRVQQ